MVAGAYLNSVVLVSCLSRSSLGVMPSGLTRSIWLQRAHKRITRTPGNLGALRAPSMLDARACPAVSLASTSLAIGAGITPHRGDTAHRTSAEHPCAMGFSITTSPVAHAPSRFLLPSALRQRRARSDNTLAAITPGDAAFAQVIGGKFHLHPISWHHTHEIQANFA